MFSMYIITRKNAGRNGEQTFDWLPPPVVSSRLVMLVEGERGEGWVYLDCKQCLLGGAVVAYKIQPRGRPSAAWADVGMAIESEITLMNREDGKE